MSRFVGLFQLFGLFWLFIVLHELAHLGVAWLVGVPVHKFRLTPLGATAYLTGFDQLGLLKQTAVLLAGPVLSLLLALYTTATLREINGVIFVFNLLPIRPLDGGQLFFVWLSRFKGMARANKCLRQTEQIGVVVLFLIGLVQLYLHPFNPSLVLLSLYLHKRSRERYHHCLLQIFLQYSKIRA